MPRVPDFESGCRYKDKHATKGAALNQAIKRAEGRPSGRARLEAYRCPFCHNWHVGKASGRRARKLKPYDRTKQPKNGRV